MTQFVEGMLLALDCPTKGTKTYCPKCGRAAPDTCGMKHPRVEVPADELSDAVSEDTHWDGIVKDAEVKTAAVRKGTK